jgi:hypothetical protein
MRALTVLLAAVLVSVAVPAASASASASVPRHGVWTTCVVRDRGSARWASGVIRNSADHLTPWIHGYVLTVRGPRGFALRRFRSAGWALELGPRQAAATSVYRVWRAVSCHVRLLWHG